MKKLVLLVLVLSLLLCGCGILEDSATIPTGGPPVGQDVIPGETPVIEVDFAKTDKDMFTNRDEDAGYSQVESVIVLLEGDKVTCNSASVKVEGTDITIAGEGTYILQGQLNDGSVTVKAGSADKLQIVLDGASIASSTTAALSVLEADKVFVTLAQGTENSLSSSGFTGTDNVDGAVFSKQDLTFNGSGTLTVESSTAHGIVCKDDLVFAGGSYGIHAAFHGLDANDSLRFKGATLSVDAGKDGIHVEDGDDPLTGFVYISGGQLDIEAEGDGISAGVWMQIAGGDLNILAGGGYENGASHNSGGYGDFMGGGPGGMGGRPGSRSVTTTATTDDASTSMKGLKADGGLLIGGGNVTVDSADDGLHCNDTLVINNGTIKIASGDDGIHAETGLKIAGGSIDISNSYEGLEAQNVHVIDGKISLVATDDGINAAGGNDSSGSGGRDQMFGGPGGPGGMSGGGNGSIVIDGGDLYIQSSGDGMDANGYLEINGGKTVICGPNRGDTATLDYDTSGTINGGTFIGTGAAGMAQTFSANAQGVLAVQVNQGQSAVTIKVSDKSGKELVSYQPELPFSVIIFSTPELVSGETYHITIGELEGDMEAY